MGFGLKERGKPTPGHIDRLFDLIASLLGIIGGFMVVASFIPKWLSDIVSPVFRALLIPASLQLKKYFSVDMPEGQKYVSMDKVDSMEEPPQVPKRE